MYVVLVPNIGISTSISNTTQICPQHFRKVMCVPWECAWCQCQILVLEPAYPTLHKYAHSTSETSCVSNGNVRGASAKYWYQHQHIQHYTNTPTGLQKLHVCPLGICIVLVLNIGICTSISNTTQMHSQQLKTSWVSTGHVGGASAKYWYQHQHIQHYPNTTTALQKLHVCPLGMHVDTSAKYWYQHQHIQHYTNTPTALQIGHVCPLGMCVLLVPNIGISTNISNTTQIRLQQLRNFMCVHWECALGLVPNIGISTSISNTTQIRPQHFRNFMCVHCECTWCQCQILVLAPAYPTLHKYAYST